MDGDPIVPDIRPIWQQTEKDPEEYAEVLENLNDTFTSIIETEGVNVAMEEVQGLLNLLGQVSRQWTANIDINTNGTVPTAPPDADQPMQFGGPVQQGASYFVGERRPERFVPNVNGRIYPNGGGSGGGVTNIHNYNKEAAAVSMAMLGMRRRQAVDSLAGVA